MRVYKRIHRVNSRNSTFELKDGYWYENWGGYRRLVCRQPMENLQLIDITRDEPWIVCAALKFTDGSIVAGPRHYDMIMHGQITEEQRQMKPVKQGFIDQFGTFYTREEAYAIAELNCQIRYKSGIPHIRELFSEDLY